MSAELKELFKKKLSRYIVVEALDEVVLWLFAHAFELKINKHRDGKLGDFRPGNNARMHKITVNHNLNKDYFLFVFAHEYAHLLAHIKYGPHKKPHGDEWKNEFSVLLQKLIGLGAYTGDLAKEMMRFSKNPSATLSAKPKLLKLMNPQEYMANDTAVIISDLPLQSQFIFKQKHFTKIEKRRTRILCKEQASGRLYLFGSTVKVEVVKH